MRILRVGDPHIKVSNLEEGEKLMNFVKQLIVGSKTGDGVNIERLEILGDLFHTHAVIRMEVLEFWNRWLQVLTDIIEVVVLVGNHDQSGNFNSDNHSLKVFKQWFHKKNLIIIDKPTMIGVYGYMPYVHSNDEFIAQAKYLADQGAKILVCHATFDGSAFENGFYAPEGINPDLIPFKKIISGHIHKEQIIANGKVDYPGTPKWDIASDANEKKGVWLYEHDADGNVKNRDLISSEMAGCSPIVSFTWSEGEEAPVIPENSRAAVELIGTSAWITKQKATLKGKVSIKTKITDKAKAVSRKVGKSFDEYLSNKSPDLFDYAKEIGLVG